MIGSCIYADTNKSCGTQIADINTNQPRATTAGVHNGGVGFGEVIFPKNKKTGDYKHLQVAICGL